MANEMFSDFTETPVEVIAGLASGDNAKTTLAANKILITDETGKLSSRLNYKVYVALLTQVDTDPPTVDVLENNLGGVVVWTYEGQGIYQATLAGAFTALKTGLFLQPLNEINSTPSSQGYGITREINHPNYIQIATLDEVGQPVDNMLWQTMIEIRVYY